MKFDYTYIPFGSFLLYEPLIIVSNAIFLSLGLTYFFRLNRLGSVYGRQMGYFMLMLAVSSVFGAVGHSVHYQLGMAFFRSVVFLMHAFSLVSAYYCFRATYTFYRYPRAVQGWVKVLAVCSLLALLVLSFTLQSFILVEAPAGIVLIFALIVYLLDMKRRPGSPSRFIVWGIFSAILSIVVHLAGLSIHTWFNQKDLAHVLMIAAMVLFYRGSIGNVRSAFVH